MVFKVSLILAILIYFVQIISGIPIEKSIIRAMLYFIIFYSVISINQIIYLHMKLHMIKLEEARKEEEKKKRKEEQQARVAKTLANFMKDPKKMEG
ncbi:MAG: hypothetical protein Q9P14_05885 [candidate division KSB1 bacterium]|nr:hypothetical protein [candidate division KSB1 bacterium]MDQ7062649.1 hypothetical protein [candidate division KSB1 bacterium]